jgi:hypothetical protein
MGNSASTAAPTLDDLDESEQQMLMRNVQFLNSRNTEHPGKFGFADFAAVHSAMPVRLAAALWRGLSPASPPADVLDLDAVVRILVPLRTAAGGASAAHLAACFGGEHAGSSGAVAREEAAPWLASVGRPAEGAVDASALIAAAACAAWLVDLRELEPLPALTEGATRLLSTEHVRFLSRALPAEQRRAWRLLFTTARDGVSFARFIALGTKRAPCVLVVRDRAGGLFGGYSSEPLSVSSQFGGGCTCTPPNPACAPPARGRTRWRSPVRAGARRRALRGARSPVCPDGRAVGGVRRRLLCLQAGHVVVVVAERALSCERRQCAPRLLEHWDGPAAQRPHLRWQPRGALLWPLAARRL